MSDYLALAISFLTITAAATMKATIRANSMTTLSKLLEKPN
jgi:hypothetical protein